MAVLQSVRILANERLDKPDFDRIQEFVCADLQAIKKHVFTAENFVVSGFDATGTGTNQLSVVLSGSTAIYGSNNGAFFIGAASLDPAVTTTLTPSATNYVEIELEQDTGGADSRAFWDQTAAGGAGGEFSQIVDTFTFLKGNLSINSSAFSGNVAKLPVCEVDVNGSGVITEIRDSRNMLFRLGRRGDATFDFPWASRIEPADTAFTGADKDLDNFKEWMDAMMTALKEVKGTTYWYELAPVSLQGGFRNTGLSFLVSNTLSAAFGWDGTSLSITDGNGAPTDADVISYIRSFDLTTDIELTRQDGGSAIALADGEILWVELPNPTGTNQTFDGVGFTSANYRVNSRGSVPLDSDVYWLAYREGTRVYLRGMGELEPGEEKQINDETTTVLKTFLGFDPEVATSVPYDYFPDATCLNYTYTSNDHLVRAISINTENINELCAILNENVYDEPLDVVVGVPADDNEVTGPLPANTLLSLPLDSRDTNAIQLYLVGACHLEVYLNGVLQIGGRDYNEVGVVNTMSSQIEILKNLVIGDEVHFRIDATGGINFIGGASQNLQSAYDVGNTITTTFNRPFLVQGGGTPGTDEIQTISFSGITPDFGAKVLSHSGNPSSSIPFTATALDVQNALNAATSLSGVSVTGTFATGFVATFSGANGETDQPLLVEVSNTLHDFPFIAAPTETFRATFSPTLAPLLGTSFDAEHSLGAVTPAGTGSAPTPTALGDIAGTGLLFTSGAATFLDYVDPGTSPSVTGTLRFKTQMPVIGTPSASNSLVTLENGSAINTIVVETDTTSGVIKADIFDEVGAAVTSLTTLPGAMAAGVTREVEVNWNYATGDYALFVDGVLDPAAFVTGLGAATTRTTSLIKMGNIAAANTDGVIIDDVQLFDLVIHAGTVAGPTFTGEVPRFIEAVPVACSIVETVQGVAGSTSKVAEFDGDIKVTGLIDPTGLVFEAQLADPMLPADDGIYVNSAHDLIQRRGTGLSDVNLTQTALGFSTATAIEFPMDNNAGGTLFKGTPVRVDTNGDLEVIDVAVEAEAFNTFAVVKSDISDATEGIVTQSGRLIEIITTASFGATMYVSTAGDLTDTKPSIGVDGFAAGDFVIRIGVITKNVTSPTLKDLIVDIAVVGQL